MEVDSFFIRLFGAIMGLVVLFGVGAAVSENVLDWKRLGVNAVIENKRIDADVAMHTVDSQIAEKRIVADREISTQRIAADKEISEKRIDADKTMHSEKMAWLQGMDNEALTKYLLAQ